MTENKIEVIVLSKAKQEADNIISGALLGASEIIERAKEKVPQIIDEYIKKANNFISAEKQRIFGRVQLEINSKMINLENEIVNRVFENLEEDLVKLFENREVYRNYLKNVISEIFKNNIFQKPIVRVNPRDYEIVKELIDDIEIIKDDSVEYGVVVEDLERGFVVRNTLKTRIERVRQIVIERIRNYWV